MSWGCSSVSCCNIQGWKDAISLENVINLSFSRLYKLCLFNPLFVLDIRILSKIKTEWYLDKIQYQNNAFPLHPWRWHTSLLEMDSLKVLLFQPTSNACKNSWAPGIVGYKNFVDMNSQYNIFLLIILTFTLEQTFPWKLILAQSENENEKYEYRMMFYRFW